MCLQSLVCLAEKSFSRSNSSIFSLKLLSKTLRVVPNSVTPILPLDTHFYVHTLSFLTVCTRLCLKTFSELRNTLGLKQNEQVCQLSPAKSPQPWAEFYLGNWSSVIHKTYSLMDSIYWPSFLFLSHFPMPLPVLPLFITCLSYQSSCNKLPQNIVTLK